MTRIRHALVLAALLAAAGCSGGSPDSGAAAGSGTPPADSITDRQRDSVIGASRLPGAQGVRGALEASDAAAERAAILDSLQNELP